MVVLPFSFSTISCIAAPYVTSVCISKYWGVVLRLTESAGAASALICPLVALVAVLTLHHTPEAMLGDFGS